MAGGSTSIYEFDSLVSGQHVYESAWTLLNVRHHFNVLLNLATLAPGIHFIYSAALPGISLKPLHVYI